MRTLAVIRHYSWENPPLPDLVWLQIDTRNRAAFRSNWRYVRREAARRRREGGEPWMRAAEVAVDAADYRYIRRMHFFEQTPWHHPLTPMPFPRCYRLRDVECCLDLTFMD